MYNNIYFKTIYVPFMIQRHILVASIKWGCKQKPNALCEPDLVLLVLVTIKVVLLANFALYALGELGLVLLVLVTIKVVLLANFALYALGELGLVLLVLVTIKVVLLANFALYAQGELGLVLLVWRWSC